MLVAVVDVHAETFEADLVVRDNDRPVAAVDAGGLSASGGVVFV